MFNRSFYAILIALFLPICLLSQSQGDTLFVNVWNYNSTTRDTTVQFPDFDNLSFEKVILKYSMRCKDELVSNSQNTNLGCGEWDYSCNTYLVDSSRIEQITATHPNFTISGFDGEVYEYTANQTYDYYDYGVVEVNSTISNESVAALGTNTSNYQMGFTDNSNSGSFSFMYTADEINASGFNGNEIDGMELYVSGDGAMVNFLKVEVANTNGSLTVDNVSNLNFTEVYHQNRALSTGANQIIFREAVQWNGTSNLAFRVSYTNTGGQTAISLQGQEAEAGSICAHNNYKVDFSSNGRVDLDAELLDQLDGEISISMWVKGHPDFLPANTTILYGYEENEGERDINIHLPWGNGQIYFDCGFDGGFDRINKPATNEQLEGQWNFWTFTKNVAAGDMRVWLNGLPFLGGVEKFRDINIKNLILGMDHSGRNNYKGEIAELRIWNTVLNLATISEWAHKAPDASHPHFDNLLLYYPFRNGSGQSLDDPMHNKTSNGSNLYWRFERSQDLFRDFQTVNVKPQIGLISGDVNQVLESVTYRDSIARNPNIVNEYMVSSNDGQAKDDDLVIINTYEYYEATPQLVYNGDTGQMIGQIEVQADGSIEVADLEYIRRFPYYNELVSFVTPYGIGLDLGKGADWYFDMSDYVHLLKGEKRLLMTLGGQWQEDMDLEFQFIVGTPPRDVLQYHQIWQGTNRIGAGRINDIINNVKFEPRQVQLVDAASYKLKSSITGHGSEGEFHQNGGTVTHTMNIDGLPFLNWIITQECSENPIYPQGGTWVYDRQGWCPGERSLLQEHDITSLVTAGGTPEFDYTTSNPFVTNGDYRFQVAHQLVAYGPANFQNDASVVRVTAPNNSAEFTRTGTICANPTIEIRNTGANELTSVNIEYWLNDAIDKQSYTWNGSLQFMESTEVTIPSTEALWYDVKQNNNVFHVEISNPNQTADEYEENNRFSSNFDLPDIIPGGVVFEIRTNNFPAENSFQVFDSNGDVVSSGNLSAANTVFTEDLTHLDGCYKFVIYDGGDDGLQWWANPNQGNGFLRVRNDDGFFKVFDPDFGGIFEYNFTTSFPLSSETVDYLFSLEVFPNPAQNYCTVKGDNLIEARVEVLDQQGRLLKLNPFNISQDQLNFDMSTLTSGIYFIRIQKDDIVTSRKVIKQ